MDALMVQVDVFDHLTRQIGEEAERCGLTEHELMEELEETKRKVFKEKFPNLADNKSATRHVEP